MSQCVPRLDMEEDEFLSQHSTLHHHLPVKEYEVAELTWKNGQLAMHGLAASRNTTTTTTNNNNNNNSNNDYNNINITPNSKPPFITIPSPPPPPPPPPPTAGTLESLVNHATRFDHLNVPWFHLRQHRSSSSSATDPITMDALVPCSNRPHNKGTCGAGAAATVTTTTTATTANCNTTTSTSGTGGMLWYNSSTSFGGSGNTLTKTDENDSVSHTARPHREAGDEPQEKKKKGNNVKSSLSTKRSRAAAVHNQSERKRRDKINQRMKTLQKLVPNSSKTDKASMLDEVIEYLKQLQAQVQMMSRMNMMMMQTTPKVGSAAAAALMLPMAMQQQQQLLQMSTMMAPMMSIGGMMGAGNLGLGGMGNVFDINTNTINNGRSNLAAPHQLIHPSANFVPCATMATNWMDGPSILPDHHHPFSAFFASQPMTMDAYSRMAAMYQQALHQPPPSTSKS